MSFKTHDFFLSHQVVTSPCEFFVLINLKKGMSFSPKIYFSLKPSCLSYSFPTNKSYSLIFPLHISL